jgi:hypothetical protein
MALDLGNADGTPAISFAEFVAKLEQDGVDLSTESGVMAARSLLAGLYANRDFLVDRAIEELKDACASQSRTNRYGAQVLMLHQRPGSFFVRANFWPAMDNPIVQASGAQHYFYDVPHDHNFDFLTLGYLGPGYRSHWLENDGLKTIGYPGEIAHLTTSEHGTLSPGRILHYRAHRDVHVQFAPASFSISINIVAEGVGTMWRDQYLFDPDLRNIVQIPTLSQAEVLLRIGVNFGGEAGLDVAHHVATHHPSHRARWYAWRALASAQTTPDGQRLILECAAADRSPQVSGCPSGVARAMLARMDSTENSPEQTVPSANG